MGTGKVRSEGQLSVCFRPGAENTLEMETLFARRRRWELAYKVLSPECDSVAAGILQMQVCSKELFEG